MGAWGGGGMMTVKHADGTNRPFKPMAANANEIIYLSIADKLFTPQQHSRVIVIFRTTADERCGGVNLQIEQAAIFRFCLQRLLPHFSPLPLITNLVFFNLPLCVKYATNVILLPFFL